MWSGNFWVLKSLALALNKNGANKIRPKPIREKTIITVFKDCPRILLIARLKLMERDHNNTQPILMRFLFLNWVPFKVLLFQGLFKV